MRIDWRVEFNALPKFHVQNRVGVYVEMYDLINKYERRKAVVRASVDQCKLEICLAQFSKMYRNAHRISSKKKDLQNPDEEKCQLTDEQDGKDSNMMGLETYQTLIAQSDAHDLVPPDEMHIEEQHPGGPCVMIKCKAPNILGIQKYNKESEAR